MNGRALLFKTFLRLPFLLPLVFPSLAQTGPQLHTPPPASQFAKKRSADDSFRFNRFLGWRFAARYGQDTSRWRRPESSALPFTITTGQSRSSYKSNLAATATPSLSTAGGFLHHPILPTGFVPTAVIQGDFNQDGKMDIALSNGGDGTLYVFLGNGDDTFQVPEVIYTAGPSPVWIATASLRNNGHLDLIVVDGDSNQVETYLGNGDGTFQPGATTPLPQMPTYLVAGDFNKDGNVDIAVGFSIAPGTSGPQFQVLLGNGSGNFPALISPPSLDNGGGETPIVTSSLAVGDLNNDGYLDVVTTVQFQVATSYLNQSGTAFIQGNSFGPSDGLFAVAIGDMNEDGCLDAIESGFYGYVTVALGTCDGNFTPANFTAAIGDLDATLSVADIDGDGHLDVVGVGAFVDGIPEAGLGSEGGYLVSVMKGDGKGNLASATVYPGGTDAFSIAIADFNGDNKPEIITTDTGDNKASMFLNDASGGFGNPQGRTIGYLSGVTNAANTTPVVETVDLNSDGKADLLLIESGQEGTLPNQITSLLSDGEGNFSAPIRSPATVGSPSPNMLFTTGDFRIAGKPDVIYVTQYESPNVVAFFPGNGDGSFGSPATLGSVPYPFQVAVGDFNGDGKLDFAVYGYSSTDQSTSEFDVFLGNGDGTFRQLPAQTFPLLTTAQPEQLIAGDFNHDGKLDLLIGYDANSGLTNSGDNLDLALGNGDGTFQPATTLMPNFGPVVVADLNHDGYLDLMQSRDPAHFLDSNDNIEYIPNALTIYLGRPGGTFEQQPTYTLPGVMLSDSLPALVGDFNGDGILDVASVYLPSVIGQPWKKQLQVLQGVGDGTFQLAGWPYDLSAYEYPMVGGDFRGVGLTDLVNLVQYTPSVHTIPAAPSASLSIAFDSVPLIGTEGSAAVTLALAATSAATVTLTSSDPAVELPPSLSFSAGDRQQSFAFTIGSGFDATHLLALSATLSGQTATAFAAKAGTTSAAGVLATLGGVTVVGGNQLSIAPGEEVPLVLNLASVDGYSGVFQGFNCSGLPTGGSCKFTAGGVALAAGGYTQIPFTLQVPSTLAGGSYSVQVGASNGSIAPMAPLSLSIGGFSLSIDPAIIVAGTPTPLFTNVTATFTGNFIEEIALTCSGLPANVTCSSPGDLPPPVTGSTQSVQMLSLSAPSGIAANDYPFQIVGTTSGLTQTVNAIFRVEGIIGSISPTAATLSSGQSAKFTVTLTSLNHFANSVTVLCQSVSGVTCPTSAPVSLTDNGSATVTLTISYQTPSTAAVHADPRSERLSRLIAPWFCLLVIPCFPLFRRKHRVLSGMIILVVCTGVVACGGGSNSGSGSGSTPPPATQTISVPVVATASYSSGTLQQSVGTITLTVPQ